MVDPVALQTMSQGWHFTSFFGVIVGWLLMAYGIVIWGAHAYDHIPSKYGLMFVAFGFGLMLFNSRILVGDPTAIMFFRFLGNLVIAVTGTAAFMWLKSTQTDSQIPSSAD